MKTKFIWFLYTSLATLYILAIGANFFSPYRYDEQNRKQPYQKPNSIKLDFKEKKLYFYSMNIKDKGLKKYEIDVTRKIPLKLFCRGYEYKFLFFKTNIHLFGTQGKDKFFLFGTDQHGRDIFSRIIKASRISLSIGLLGVAITFFIGMFIGGLSGYLGGKVDSVIMRFCEIIMCFPFFFLMLALRAMLPLTLSSKQVYLGIILIMSLIAWPSFARVIRGMVLSIKKMDYITSARVLGVGHIRMIFKHILPNTFSYAIVSAFLSIPSYIIGEAGLSFIGLGIQDPDPSWGNMLASAMNLRVLTSFPWILTPGIMIFITVIIFNLIGDHLRDKFDVKC